MLPPVVSLTIAPCSIMSALNALNGKTLSDTFFIREITPASDNTKPRVRRISISNIKKCQTQFAGSGLIQGNLQDRALDSELW